MIEKNSDVFVRTLIRGDYFGERALLRFIPNTFDWSISLRTIFICSNLFFIDKSYSEERRTANVIAQSSEVECLVLDREWVSSILTLWFECYKSKNIFCRDFTQLIGNLDELKEKDYHDEVYRGTRQAIRYGCQFEIR